MNIQSILVFLLAVAAFFGLTFLAPSNSQTPTPDPTTATNPSATPLSTNTSTGAIQLPIIAPVDVPAAIIVEEYRWFPVEKIKKAYFVRFVILAPNAGLDPVTVMRQFVNQSSASHAYLTLVGPRSPHDPWYIAGSRKFFAQFGEATLDDIFQAISRGNHRLIVGRFFHEPFDASGDTLIYLLRKG